MEQPGQAGVEIGHFDNLPEQKISFGKKVGDIQVSAEILPQAGFVVFKAETASESDAACFLSLKADFQKGVPYSFVGEVKSREVFRQSPHDPGIYDLHELVKQDVPMFAIQDASGFTVAINDTPALYDNYTTQTLDPEAHGGIVVWRQW